jgi:hypothetical protein
MCVLDDYRMQEVAYGHAGFLGGITWSTLPYAWLEHHLLTPVTARYASAKPADIAYQIDGKWVDGTSAAKANDWHRVRVVYDNGLVVVANSGKTPMKAGKYTLPHSGWMAHGAGVTAYTAINDGVLADYCETAGSVFANARDAADWNISGLHRIRPRVKGFAQTGARSIRFTYSWDVKDRLPQNYACFVHFVSSLQGAKIELQQDHAPTVPASEWKRGETVYDGAYTLQLPEQLGDGDYNWCIGLYDPRTYERVPLDGVDCGNQRIRLGTLHVRNNGGTIAFDPETGDGSDRFSIYEENLNTSGKVLDFGTVRTNGSVNIRREGSEWVLQTWPRDKSFVVEINVKHFGRPSVVRCAGGASETVIPKVSGGWWRLPLNGAREYRWRAK